MIYRCTGYVGQAVVRLAVERGATIPSRFRLTWHRPKAGEGTYGLTQRSERCRLVLECILATSTSRFPRARPRPV